jgi:rfaE bifunctional protein kinase chain/domain
MTRLLVVGDALLDRDVAGTVERICPDAPVPVVDVVGERSRPGGAGLAAALLAADGVDVVLLTALAADAAGRELRDALERSGVEVLDLGLEGTTPEKVRVRAAGQSLLRLDRGTGGPVGTLTPSLRGALAAGVDGVLVADYGRGVAAAPDVRAALAGLPPRVPIVWDPHPRGPEPIPGVRLVTPNAAEAARLVPEVAGDDVAAATARAATLAERWRVTAVVVTRGARGALLAGHDGPPFVVPAPPVDGGDPCGAGDRFAGAAALALAAGALIPRRWSGRWRARRRSWRPVARTASPPDGPPPRRHHRRLRPSSARPTSTRWWAQCGRRAARWSPPAGASTSSTPATSGCCRRHAGSATAWWCCSTPTCRCPG